MNDEVGDVINIPVALSYLTPETLKNLDDAMPSLLPCDVAIALNLFYAMDFEERSVLIRTHSINTLEDAINTLSAIDLDEKSDRERQHIQEQILEARRVYMRALRGLEEEQP